MISRAFSIALMALAMITPSFAQILFSETPESVKRQLDEAERQTDEAERRIVRLKPDRFPQLPVNLVRELERRKCRIPQNWPAKKPHNVIKGEFAKPGQTDWAVLCSVRGVSSILVFWNGSEEKPAELAAAPERNWAQLTGFSRGIDVVAKRYIALHYRAHGGPKPPPIDHQGIEDAFIEKGATVLYFYRGKWLKLTGAD